MTFPFDDVMLASGSLDRPVLLSERSQLIAIKALQVAENRMNWDEITDTDWDTLEDYVADALTEILTIQDVPEMTITNLGLQRTSNVSISTFPYVVAFQTGSGYDSGNPTRLTPGEGDVIVQANIQITSGSATSGYIEIRKNIGIGTVVLARDNLAASTNNVINIAAIDTADSDDFYELVIQSSVPITIQTGVFFPKLECKVFA